MAEYASKRNIFGRTRKRREKTARAYLPRSTLQSSDQGYEPGHIQASAARTPMDWCAGVCRSHAVLRIFCKKWRSKDSTRFWWQADRKGGIRRGIYKRDAILTSAGFRVEVQTPPCVDHVMSTSLAKARGVLGHLHLAARREGRPPVHQRDQVLLLELLTCDVMWCDVMWCDGMRDRRWAGWAMRNEG